MGASIIFGKAKKKISHAKLLTIPQFQFVRSDGVELYYNGGSIPIKDKCQRIEKYLKPIMPVLEHTNSIRFSVNINQDDQASFSDHTYLLRYLSEQLQHTLNLSHYEFEIYFWSNRNAGANVISSLLQMPPIRQCSNFEISLWHIEEALELPIKTVSDWLNPMIDGRKTYSRIPQEIFMKIRTQEIQNVTELYDHLSKVHFIFIAFLLRSETLFDFYDNTIKIFRFLHWGL